MSWSMRGALGLCALSLLACRASMEAPMEEAALRVSSKDEADMAASPVRGGSGPSAAAERERSVEGGEAPDPEPAMDAPAPSEPGAPSAARAWFPETMLWEPRVATGEDGLAEVELRVPDSLTTWRVLGLAHDAQGGLAGAETRFDSRMEVYLDVALPRWLMVGDRLELPVRAVNEGAEQLRAPLRVSTRGALSGGTSSSVELGPSSSALRQSALVAIGAGPAALRAELGERDAVEHPVHIRPTGRPVEQRRGGSLSSQRSLRLVPPAGADPATDRIDVLVFPGALAVARQELERVDAGAEAAVWGYLLADRVMELSRIAGAEISPDTLRRVRLLAAQGLAARAPGAEGPEAGLLLAGLGDAQPSWRAGLVRRLEESQRADGTWAWSARASLQEVLMLSAWSARALPEESTGARVRAAGALERFASEVRDPLTAAAMVASGLLDEGLAEELRARVREAIQPGPEGASDVQLPAGLSGVRGPVSRAEALAWVVLALPEGDPDRGELVSRLLSGYDAERGLGAGDLDPLVLEAVVSALPAVAQPVQIRLARDGQTLDEARLDPAQPLVPAVLSAELQARGGELSLAVEPELPGLAWVATRRSWVPWTGAEGLPGVEVELELPALEVGRESLLQLSLAAPAGQELGLELGLPAGLWVDEAAAAELPGLRSLRMGGDRLRLQLAALEPGEVRQLALRVRPQHAGRFSSGPIRVEIDGQTGLQAPPRWVIAPAR